jgi:hypothetical protein
MRAIAGVGWSLNGFDLTGTDAAGTEWEVTSGTEGWDDPAGTSSGVVPNDYADGGHLEPTFLEPPSLVLKGRIRTAGRGASLRAMAELKAAIPVRALGPLAYLEEGVLKHRKVKQEGKPNFKRLAEHLTDYSIQLVAPDVRVFSGDGSAGFTYTDTTALPETTGGLQLPAQVPFQIAATVTSGSVVIRNAGDARPPVKVLIQGPAVNPSIIADDGSRMSFALTVGTGQTLEVDLDRKTVKLNGVNRRNALTGAWIVPRAGTELKFNATTYNTTARMTVQWSDAWS